MRTVALGEVAAYHNGKAFRPDEWSEAGIPIVRIANLTDPMAPFHYFQGTVDPRHLIDTGDLVVSWSATLDAFIWTRGPAVLNQHIFKVVEQGGIDRRYLYLALRGAMSRIRARVHGATMQHVTKGEFESVLIPVPAIEKQQSVATKLMDQLALVERARTAIADKVATARVLQEIAFSSFLASSRAWPAIELAKVTSGRPSPSTESDGDTPVITVTSACLTPVGFGPSGLVWNRMSSRSAVLGLIQPGEVLVSRSNTADLVGRAARYTGEPRDVVATDLTFRIVPDPSVLSNDYAARFLAALQASGYWRSRAGGASSTMSKISKKQLMEVLVPVPPLDRQRELVNDLEARLATIDRMTAASDLQLEAIDALPATLLRRAFADA